MARQIWDSHETRALRIGSRASFVGALFGTMGTTFSFEMLHHRYLRGEDVFDNIPLDIAAVVFPILTISLQLLSNRLSRREREIRSSARIYY